MDAALVGQWTNATEVDGTTVVTRQVFRADGMATTTTEYHDPSGGVRKVDQQCRWSAGGGLLKLKFLWGTVEAKGFPEPDANVARRAFSVEEHEEAVRALMAPIRYVVTADELTTFSGGVGGFQVDYRKMPSPA